MITVQPAKRAGATLVVMIMKGAFQGAIAATTPTGSRTITAVPPTIEGWRVSNG